MWRYNGICFFLTLVVFISSSCMVEAGVLMLEPTEIRADPGDTFQVQVRLDPQGDSVSSVDVWLVYDPQVVQVNQDVAGQYAIAAGSLFQRVNYDVRSDRLYIYGIPNEVGDTKTEMGTIATVTFRAIEDGSTQVSFLCNTSGSGDTSKIILNDLDATNVIECSGTNPAQVIVGDGGSGSDFAANIVTSPLPRSPEQSIPQQPLAVRTAPQRSTEAPLPQAYQSNTPPQTMPQSGSVVQVAGMVGAGVLFLGVGWLLHKRYMAP